MPTAPEHRGGRRAAARGAAWALAALAALAPGCGGAHTPPTGVLLVSIDSLRADHLSCYGYRSATRPDQPTTPAIDRMVAARGARFADAVSTTSWTLPAHMAMLTGLPDEVHGVREVGLRLADSHRLLAETFRDAGWRTAGFWSGPNLHPFFGFGRGFERYVDCSSSRVSDEGVFAVRNGMTGEQIADKRRDLKDVHDASHKGVTGPTVVREVGEWLAQVDGAERFFAFVHLWDVHYDYEPPPEFDVFYPTYGGSETGADVHARSLDKSPPDADGLRRIVSLYDGELLFTDDTVARLLGHLADRGRLDETLVMLTADHGEEFLEHRMLGHGNSLYEESVRVPLLLRYPPGVPEGAVVDLPVSLLDVAPTVLDFCGLPAPRGAFGRSLRPALAGDRSGLSDRLLPLERAWLVPGEELRLDAIRAARGAGHKVIRQRDSDGGKMFFYDLVQDPGERSPVPTGKLEKSDARVRGAGELWSSLDRRGGRTLRLEEMPERLIDDLTSTGYLGTEGGGR